MKQIGVKIQDSETYNFNINQVVNNIKKQIEYNHDDGYIDLLVNISDSEIESILNNL